jgi:hypothetical protein
MRPVISFCRAELIDAETDRHLWVERFDHDIGNLLALHSWLICLRARTANNSGGTARILAVPQSPEAARTENFYRNWDALADNAPPITAKKTSRGMSSFPQSRRAVQRNESGCEAAIL